MQQKKIITYVLNSVEYIGTAKHPKREQLNQIVTIEQGTNYIESLYFLIKKTGFLTHKFIRTKSEVKKYIEPIYKEINLKGRFEFQTPKNNYCITTKTTVITNFNLELK